jgi:tetratricopeptide (TPR) repeat protein
MVSVPRSMAHQVEFEQVSRIPRPLIQIEENARATYIDISNIQQLYTYFAPEITRLGYVIKDDLSDDELRQYIPGMFDALMQVPNLLLDGFANHDVDSEVPFQARVGADVAFGDDLLAAECGWVVPAMIYGALCERSNRRYSEIYPILHQAIDAKNSEDIDRMINNFIDLSVLSVGEIFGHTVNTLAFTVISQKNSASEDFAKLIDYASRYPVDYQDLNALSNLANFRLKMNQIDLAEEAIDRAISKVETSFVGVINQTNSMLMGNGGNETIDQEIYETYFLIKSRLGKIAECKAIALKAKAFAEKVSGAEGLLATANSYLTNNGIN